MKAVVLDSGALIGLERRHPRVLALIAELIEARQIAHTPAGVVAQVWRGSPRQHALLGLVRSRFVVTAAMTEDVALQIGVLLGETRTQDLIDAHVVLLARRLDARVFTSDEDDLHRIDPGLDTVRI